MSIYTFRARRAAIAGVALALPALLAGCNVKEELLNIQQPQIIGPDNVGGATGAAALRVGALGSFQGWVMGGGGNSSNIAMFGDLLTDEWKSGDTFAQHNETDQRVVQTNNSVLAGEYSGVQTRTRTCPERDRRARGVLAGARRARSPRCISSRRTRRLMLSEDFCNGIPFGSTVNGVVTYTQPLTNKDGLTMAIARLDTALKLATGTDAFSLNIHYTLEVAKARALVDLGQFAAAAALARRRPDELSVPDDVLADDARQPGVGRATARRASRGSWSVTASTSSAARRTSSRTRFRSRRRAIRACR